MLQLPCFVLIMFITFCNSKESVVTDDKKYDILVLKPVSLSLNKEQNILHICIKTILAFYRNNDYIFIDKFDNTDYTEGIDNKVLGGKYGPPNK